MLDEPARGRKPFGNPLFRRCALAMWDSLSWSLAIAVILGVRLNFTVNDGQWRSVLRYWVIGLAILVLVGYASKFYRGLYRIGSFEEALGLALHFGGVGILTATTFALLDPMLPRSLPILVPPIAIVISATGRWCFRAIRDRSDSSGSPQAQRAVIYGAGSAGYQILRLLRAENSPPFHVVGFIDDNPNKRHLRLQGVPVIGDGAIVQECLERVDAEVVILAITTATGDFVGRVQKTVQAQGLKFLVLPPLAQLISGGIDLESIRQVEIGDVLGRHPIVTSVGDIAGYLLGKRVLVTGAGGSIGSELARQVHRFGPSSLTLLDHDESGLHAVQLSIFGHGLLDRQDTVLCDIRDVSSMRRIFAEHRPEIVFHAAALKHLPMLERFPEEGWKTNVCGTLNVLQVASEFEVQHFVNISTDKAADSTSVLGSTKRLAERLTAWQAETTGRPYMSVRFGNVLGSRGSMLHTFTDQIERGGPLTVTHPDVTRYFMTIPEACELVIQAGALGQVGDALVLEMGTPVKILDVAKRMIALSGRDVKIVFTGLTRGEKMHEALFGESERPQLTEHPLIRRVRVPSLEPENLPHPRLGADL